MDDTPPTVLPQHAALIEASAISPEVAAARGYRSIEKRSDLQRMGFTKPQWNVPCLLVPIHDVHGEVANYQIRPDAPRIDNKRGKKIKYETPAESKMVLDVPPNARAWLGNPERPLFITEGVRKADAAVSKGMCCIAVLGVWNWRGRNADGGLSALPDWELIALKDRNVYIAYDSDAFSKPEVRLALARLRELLRSRGAHVKVIQLPAGDGGTKVGLDDYLAAGHGIEDLLALVTDQRLQNVAPGEDASYEATEHGLVFHKEVQGGTVAIPLTNFTTRIVTEVSTDDGVEAEFSFELEALLNRENKRFMVPARQFPGMTWVLENLGASALVYPGMSIKDHARAAIQVLSKSISKIRIYSHLGWTRTDGVGVYLHAGGAIGSRGVVDDVHVAVPGALGRYLLPPPPEGNERALAVRASLDLLKLGPSRVMVPIFAAIYRAPLGGGDVSLHVAGPTGEGKTAIAALAQQHHGAGLDAEHLPGAWSSTGNALEALAFHAKDSLLVVDDFVPRGTQTDVQRMHREAERLFRAQGNSSGRQRLRPDGSLRPPKHPRGLVLSTGEEVPRGQSLRARTLVIEVSPGDVDWNAITVAQSEAAVGKYALAFSAFIQSLAGRIDSIQASLKIEIQKLREKAVATGQHKRTPSIVANLALGLRAFLDFALEIHVIADAEANELWRVWWAALGEAAQRQQQQIDHEEPTRRFFELLTAAISGGQAHVAGPEGQPPQKPMTWGWREYHSDEGVPYWRELGTAVGWIDGDDLYLQPESSYTVAQQQARAGGDALTITSKTLHKRLFEKSLLLSREGARQTYTVRRNLQGARRGVLHVRAASLMPRGPDQPDQPDQQMGDGPEGEDSEASSWSGSWSGPPTAPDQQPDQTLPEPPRDSTPAPVLGQVGQVPGDIDKRLKREGSDTLERIKL